MVLVLKKISFRFPQVQMACRKRNFDANVDIFFIWNDHLLGIYLSRCEISALAFVGGQLSRMFCIWSTDPCRASYYGNSLLSFLEVWEVMNLLGFLPIPSWRKFGKCRPFWPHKCWYVGISGEITSNLSLRLPTCCSRFLSCSTLVIYSQWVIEPFCNSWNGWVKTWNGWEFSAFFLKQDGTASNFQCQRTFFSRFPTWLLFILNATNHTIKLLTGCKQYTSKINCVKFTTKMRKKLQLVVGVPIILCSPFMGH